MGFRVFIATEDDWGKMVGPKPNGISEKIRKWLQENYITLKIKYVLLIGNPDPAQTEDKSRTKPENWRYAKYKRIKDRER